MAVALQRCIKLGQLSGLYKRFSSEAENGVIYDKQPVKVFLEAGKPYWWCCCGKSCKQPFCDGTHKIPELKIKQKPVKIEVKESRDYWLCLCKQTFKRPFCDGTHKGPAVQNASSLEKDNCGK